MKWPEICNGLGRIVLLAFCTGSVAAQQADTNKLIPTLKRIQADWHRAYVVSDSARLTRLLGPQATVTRSSGIVLGRSKMLNFYRTRDTMGLRVSTKDQDVLLNGSLAVITSRVDELDKGIPYSYYVTDVLAADKSGWLIVHSQWTLLPGQWNKVDVDSAILKSYSGNYISASGKKNIIEAGTNELVLTNSQGRKFLYTARSSTQFFRPGEPDELLFVRDGEGAPFYVFIATGFNTTVFHRSK